MIIELGKMTKETKQPGLMKRDNPLQQFGNIPL